MPTFDEVLAAKDKYPDETEITLPEGVKSTLGQLRSGYMKDADYRKKTSDIARQRETLERERSDFETGYQEAQAKLTEMARELLAKKPDTTGDELASELTKTPEGAAIAKQMQELRTQIDAVTQAITQQRQINFAHEQAYIADQHRRVLAELQKSDPELNDPEKVKELVEFAKARYVPRIDDAYRLMTYEKQLEKAKTEATEAGRKEGYEKAKKELMQPVIRPRRALALPGEKETAKTFDEAAERALEDPEIVQTIVEGWGETLG